MIEPISPRFSLPGHSVMGNGVRECGDVETVVSMPMATVHCADSLEANLLLAA